MAQLNTRIILRNDSTANWNAATDAKLAKGEIGLEFQADGKIRMKVGDGTLTWAELPYFGGEDAKNFQVSSLDEITETDLAVGDTAIVKTAIYVDAEDDSKSKYSYTGYVYNGTAWAAMDGNYSAENVFLTSDITLAGDYTSVGNIKKSDGTLEAAGKSVATLLQEIFLKRLQPSITSNPSASITLTNAGAKEVGTEFDPQYTTSFSDGGYTYETVTGVKATAWAIKMNGVDYTTSSGDGDTFVVTDDTNVKATGTVTYSDGNVAVDNLGDPSSPAIQIDGKTIDCTASSAVTGYRKWFIYIGEDHNTAVDSAFIRKGTDKGNAKNAATQSNVTVPAGTTRILVALPKSDTYGYKKTLTGVTDVDGMGLPVLDNFTESTVTVYGAVDGEHGMDYRVYECVNANGMAATRYTFTIG